MWPLLSKLLSALGQPGRPSFAPTSGFVMGDPNQPDSDGGARWKTFARTEALWHVWGPAGGSPWVPFHCVTLFAALDVAVRKSPKGVGPKADLDVPAWLRPPTPLPGWAREGNTMVLLDLPGPQTVSAAYYFVNAAGFQPVCTFDNWPNRAGVLTPESILGALLHYAAAVSNARAQITAASPPLWICDSDRFVRAKPSPGMYDNRYVLEDRLLPGPNLLRAAGIFGVTYVHTSPSMLPTADLCPYFAELIKQGFTVRVCSALSAESFANAQPMPPPRVLPSDGRLNGLIRSSAGGFGGIVPTPSSSSGG